MIVRGVSSDLIICKSSGPFGEHTSRARGALESPRAPGDHEVIPSPHSTWLAIGKPSKV